MLKPLRPRFLALLLLALSAPAHGDARFRDLNKDYGLPTGSVFSFLQDRQGYVWLASSNGLERYDGYKFTIFKHKPNDPGSIASDFIKALYEDPAGRLWVGTYGGGLDLYQPESGTFLHYHHKESDRNSIASDKIFALSGTVTGQILIGTFDSGLDVLDPASGQIQHFTASDGSGLSHNRINAILIDKHAHIWLATSHGLDELDLLHRIIHAHENPGGKDEANAIYGITEETEGSLLLATGDGLHSFQPGVDAFDLSKTLRSVPNEFAKGVTNLFIDSDGNIWIAGAGSGLSVFEQNTHELRSLVSRQGSSDGMTSQFIYSVYQDRTGLIWCGTDVGAETLDLRMLSLAYLTPYDLNGSPHSATNHIEDVVSYKDSVLISTNTDIYRLVPQGTDYTKQAALFAHIDPAFGRASAMQLGTDGSVLVATNRNHLLKINDNGRIVHQWDIGTGLGLPGLPIRNILQEGSNIFYLGTFGNGLLEYHADTGVTQRISGTSTNGLLGSDQVETLIKVAPNRLLAGTFRGLFTVDLRDRSSSQLSLWSNATEPVIQALYRDEHGDVWVGTYEGLWRLSFSPSGELHEKKYFPQASNGSTAEILAIEEDRDGNLWMTSDNAVIRFDPRTAKTLILGREQGMPPLEYYSYTHTRASNDWLWFGGVSGVLGLNPALVQPNAINPQVVVSGITTYKNDKQVEIPLHGAQPLETNYQDSIVTFDAFAADFADPSANTFSYRLVGFRSDWTAPSTNHQITFTNLNPGRYRLEIRAANNWGIWSKQPAALDMVVLPPWWRTWWAYTLYFLIIIGSSIGYVYSLKRKIEREKQTSASLREANEIKSNFVDKLQTQVAAATKELRETLQGVNLKNAELEIAQKRAAEGEQIKSQFLANMSHELRTPLTGVLGYTKLLGSTHLNSEQKDYVGTIRQSSETLLAIINDTLDHSRLEAGKLLIDEVDFDLLEVIESTLELVAPTAYQKRLELIRVVPPEVPLQLRGDPLRLRQVLTNLLSNAIKFTEHGSVSIQLRTVTDNEREATIVFTVSDTGIGIPAGELPQLFHAYARSRISTRHHVEGTGLGLSICKKLLDLMGGTIQVKSRVGSGTSFDFQLTFKQQKNAQPRSRLPKRIKVLLYDMQPLSNQAWQACLTRLGAEVENAADLEAAVTVQADAAVMVLTERELTQLNELKRKLSMAPPPMLILAPRIDRQALKDLSEALYHRVLSKTAREKTLYLELQSLLQTAVHESGDAHKTAAPISPGSDAPLVLIADDNRINRRLLVTMLNHAGFRVAEASNGLELLDMAARGPWDAALLDIHMPGMDGLEAAAKLRASMGDKLPPVIAMSADVMPETRKQLDGVMDDFLVKPFSEQELVEKLRWHLDRHARKKRGELQPS